MSQDEQKLPDTAQKASPAASLSDAEVLQAIKEKIKEYFAEDRELFRGLCELYCGSGIGLERYRKLLIKANLLKSRASEITVVLKQTKICAKFLSKTQPLTWSEALQAARDAAPGAEERLGARLADLLVEKEAFWL